MIFKQLMNLSSICKLTDKCVYNLQSCYSYKLFTCVDWFTCIFPTKSFSSIRFCCIYANQIDVTENKCNIFWRSKVSNDILQVVTHCEIWTTYNSHAVNYVINIHCTLSLLLSFNENVQHEMKLNYKCEKCLMLPHCNSSTSTLQPNAADKSLTEKSNSRCRRNFIPKWSTIKIL